MGEILISVIFLVSNMLLYLGVIRSRKSYILPWMILHILAVVGLLVVSLSLFVVFVFLSFSTVGLIVSLALFISCLLLLYW